MDRLSGLDAAFLSLETGSMHFHVMAVMVLDPSAGMDGAPAPGRVFDRVRAVVGERIHLVPPLRRRVVRVPFGIHHPVWVEDPSFDLDYHVRRASLPVPGGPGELAAFVADVAGRPLAPDSPLWELHVVEGLDSGHVAVVAKVHHALFDGSSGVEVVAAFLDDGPVPRVVPSPSRPWRPDPVPTEAELMGAAVSSLLHQPERAAGALRRTFGAVRDLAERNRRLREEDDSAPPPAPFRAPRTSLNGAISPHRRFATVQVPLEDIRAVRRAFGGTVNDVVLAATAGALRRLLAERGERLDDPLVALVPMSTRAGPGDNALGNRVSAMLVSLATHVADPVERYRAVAAGTRLAKDQARVLSEDLVRGWAQLAFPAVSSRVARLASNLRLFDHVPPLFNVVVSNIVGADVPLWCAGARLVGLYPVGPIVEGVGVNVTVASYEGTLYVGILGCRELVPEVLHLGDHIDDAFAELAKAAVRSDGHWS
ncbi:MAG TPA: wax ester/triacylglycerol synthase family O-acyltransferase [Acidimicrobiales bacterium]|nr:wax ester/triacylglycerol synthase family O-acyltransferase [Acidimicrobiales bacterium]